MSGTVAAAAKAQLLGTSGVLSGLAGMSGVTVSYSLPRDVPREIVYGGQVSGPVSLAAMQGGARIKRQEDLTLHLHIRVYKPGQSTTEASDTRAAAISTVIEEYIAANPTLGGVADLKKAAAEAVELDGFVDDDGATSTLTLTVGLMSYLS